MKVLDEITSSIYLKEGKHKVVTKGQESRLSPNYNKLELLSRHQVTDADFYEGNSTDTRPYGEKGEDDINEECSTS